MTTEKGIILHDWEVRAVLNGATQIRRVVKPQPRRTEAQGILSDMEWWTWQTDVLYSPLALTDNVVTAAPFQPGQRLWVRETWKTIPDMKWCNEHQLPYRVCYKADDSDDPPWRSPVTMFLDFSRITLEVTSVGAGRVQDLATDLDSLMALGWPSQEYDINGWSLWGPDWFSAHWNADNPKYPWLSNPWNWVYGVRRVE